MKLLITTQKVDRNDPVLGFFHRWLEVFAEYYERVHVICLEEGEHALPDNVSVYSLGKERADETFMIYHKGWGRAVYAVRFLRYIVRMRREYDAVLVHMNPEYIVLGGLFWRILGKRVGLWYAHGAVTFKLRLAALLAHKLFTTTSESLRVATSKKFVLGHGIDVTLFRPETALRPKREFVVVSVGRISPIKDYETLVEAVNILARKLKDIHLIIAGGPGTLEQQSYYEKIQALVRAKGLQDVVSFKGAVLHDQVPELFQRAHVFAHTSRTGSLDKTVLEAMATETPVVSSNEAITEIVPESLAQVVYFPKGDSVILAEKLETIHRLSPVERERLGKELRAIVVEKHSLPALIHTIANHVSA